MIGIVNLSEAIKKAQSVNLDLVEIAPGASPPVCKILDFGKYKYDAKKKAQAAKKKQKIIQIKELKLRPNIGKADLEIKLKQIQKFISEENKVKISIVFKGRELAHTEVGMDLCHSIISTVEEYAKPDFTPKVEGKQIIIMLSPNPT